MDTNSFQVDITDIVGISLPVIGALATWFITRGMKTLTTWAESHLSILQDQNNREEFEALMGQVSSAAEMAVNHAYGWAIQNQVNLSHPNVKSQTISNALNFVNSMVKEQVTKLGLTDGDVSKIIESHLGKLMISDPTVSMADLPPVMSVTPIQAITTDPSVGGNTANPTGTSANAATP